MNYVKNSSPSREMIPFPLIKQFEQERGCVVSGIECYMKQYGVSKQEVHDEFWKQIVNAWKDINKVCIRLTEVPVPLLTCVVNLAWVMDLLYKDEDAYTHLGGVMVKGITSMLVDPVPVWRYWCQCSIWAQNYKLVGSLNKDLKTVLWSQYKLVNIYCFLHVNIWKLVNKLCLFYMLIFIVFFFCFQF